MALRMYAMPFTEPQPVRRARCEPSQRQHYRAPGAECLHRCMHLNRQVQTSASHRSFASSIQNSWRNRPHSSWNSAVPNIRAETSIRSRWRNGGRDSDSPILQDAVSNSSSPTAAAQGRFSHLFSKQQQQQNPTTYNATSGSTTGGSSYIPASITSVSQSTTAADHAAPWVLIALIPTMVWCITWGLTGGMLTLTNTCLSGMTSIAQLLFPHLPIKGVGYEDIAASLVKGLNTGADYPTTWTRPGKTAAASLVKGLNTGADYPTTWTRPGLWIPAWMLRLSMITMFKMATASSSIAATLIPVPHWLAISGASQGLMYFTCLLLMLPLGFGLSNLAKQMSLLTQRYRISVPSLKLGVGLPRFNDNTVLALKLTGILAWPCISTAAILQPLIASQSTAVTFPLAAAQVATSAAAIAVLLMLAVTAGQFAVQLVQLRADADAVQGFGYRVGLVCAAQAMLNVVQGGLSLVSGQAVPGQLVMPIISTLILGRVVWSIWRLFRIGSAPSSLWLQLLTVAPGSMKE